MKKFFLLVIFFGSLSVNAQTDVSLQDSLLRVQRIQDSIRDRELFEILNPSQFRDVDFPEAVEPIAQPEPPAQLEEPLKPEENKEVTQNSDTVQTAQTSVDSTDTQNIRAKDTLTSFILPPDSLKTDSLSHPDTKQAALDTLTESLPPPDTLSPKITISLEDVLKLPLDSLNYDELLVYYQAEPGPPETYKGPDVGDSLFYELDPITRPTNTVEGYPLKSYHNAFEGEALALDTISTEEQRLKPKISLGVGRMGFHGDLYKKQFQPISMGRPAFDMAISHRITPYLQLDFNVLFGKLGANERLNNRNENFSSEIRAGGLNLLYDFGNFIPLQYKVRPFVSLGAMGFEFLSKTDLMDRNGNYYHYWNDGSIKDRAENSPEAHLAVDLQRDYVFESDIRELNRDGFGKYPERAFAFPIGAGFIMKVTDRVDLKLNFQYYFSTTDYIDGISEKSLGNRVGNKRNDNWTYTSFSLQYDLTYKKRTKPKQIKTFSNADWYVFDNEDRDEDGVVDLQDDCLGTAAGAPVDDRGCPLDEDNDGVPNYRDDELATASGMPVNARGVGQTDDYWQKWYDDYMNDTLAVNRITETVGNVYAPVVKKEKEKKDNFTVELVRYAGPIPSDELAFLLSIGDINSVTLDDGTTVVYTSGSYDKLSTAIKRRDEFRTTGNKGAGISRIKGKEIVQVGDDELQRLLESEIEELLNINVGDSILAAAANPVEKAPEEESFNKEDVVYRVQLGAFKNKISTKVFNTSAGVLELKTGENVFRYVTKGYRTIDEAAAVRADLVVQGYSDAFVTAYKGGKRIPMRETGATMDKGYKEDLSEDKTFNSIDKSLLVFKIQLGPLKKPTQEAAMDEKVKDLPQIDKQTTATGNIRYTAGGDFSRLDSAEKLRKELEEKGYSDAFIIATFKNEIISIQEAMELMR